MQVIYYGAPGTGKSYSIDNDILKSVDDDYVFRVTFYPDYTYNDFVGQLLPTIDRSVPEKPVITYDFHKGVFTQALEKAYEDTSKDVFLIIEEMSRADCAAVFGDIFQLLDREDDGVNKGYSRYFINNELMSMDIVAIKDTKVKLPPNFHIYGTVNTSDQNVFVMDTAFKRRFEWQYINCEPVIDINQADSKKYLNNPILRLHKGEEKIDIEWIKFYQKLNAFITDKELLNLGEDKQLGPFFIKFNMNDDAAEDRKRQIKNKLLHYLWNDVYKATFKNNVSLFCNDIGTFSDLYSNFENDKQIFSDQFIDTL